jgi:hypothetical protein
MDSWEVKKTPVEGLWEIARLENVDRFPSEVDSRVRKFSDYINEKINHRYNDSLPFIGVDTWHIDGPSDFFNYSLMMCHGEPATEISMLQIPFSKHLSREARQNDDVPPFKLKPCTLYLMGLSVIHRGPQIYSCGRNSYHFPSDHIKRFLSRIFLSYYGDIL